MSISVARHLGDRDLTKADDLLPTHDIIYALFIRMKWIYVFFWDIVHDIATSKFEKGS